MRRLPVCSVLQEVLVWRHLQILQESQRCNKSRFLIRGLPQSDLPSLQQKALHASPQQALCRDRGKEERKRGTPVTGLIRYWAASSSETSSLTGICKHRLQLLSREPKSCSSHLASHLPRPSDSHHVLMQAIMLDVSHQLWPPPMCDSGPGCNMLIEFARTGHCCLGEAEHSGSYQIRKRDIDRLLPGALSLPTGPWQ